MFVSPCIESGCHFLRTGRFSSCSDAAPLACWSSITRTDLVGADCEKAARPTLQNGRKNFCVHYTHNTTEWPNTHTNTSSYSVVAAESRDSKALRRQPARLLCCAGCLNCFLNTQRRRQPRRPRERGLCWHFGKTALWRLRNAAHNS